ncbi:STAS domain-containing protein [Streptomyces sp. So13.3]|nr:STAS domain-containing protein [Streptomyces sp. So13.3]
MTQLSVTTRTLPCDPVIEMAGELDHHTASHVRDLLPGLAIDAGQQLLLDLSGLTFCDSTGITVLIAARHYALAAHASIVLIAVPAHIRRILHIVCLEQVFPAYGTVPEAETAPGNVLLRLVIAHQAYLARRPLPPPHTGPVQRPRRPPRHPWQLGRRQRPGRGILASSPPVRRRSPQTWTWRRRNCGRCLS